MEAWCLGMGMCDDLSVGVDMAGRGRRWDRIRGKGRRIVFLVMIMLDFLELSSGREPR